MIESGAARRRPAHGPVHLAAPGRAHRAHPDRRPAHFRRALRRGIRPRARRAWRSCWPPERSTCTPPISKPSPPWRCWSSPRRRPDMVVLEVGLGGRLDATNVVHPGAVRDHARRFRSRSVSGPQPGIHRRRKGRDPEARRAGGLRAAAAAKRPRCWSARRRAWHSGGADRRRGRIDDLELDARGSRFLLSGERDLRIACPLAGEHQVENAVDRRGGAARSWACPDAAIEAGIAQTRWPGRLERVSEHPEIILDGAHNPAGARALAAYIDALLRRPARAPDLRRHARQGRRRDRRHSVSARPSR